MASDRWQVVHGDCLEQLRALPDACVDAVVTDPPAGIGFMGKEWDDFSGTSNYGMYEGKHFSVATPRIGAHKANVKEHLKARTAFVTFMTEVMAECLRVLKPGGHALVWAIPRTSHWTATAVEDAGFEIRDVVMHLFGNGFPKSLDVSKAIDKKLGAEREVVGYDAARARPNRKYESGAIGNIGGSGKASDRTDNGATITAPATEDAARWNGWGTALKPAAEHWILARKPLVGTVAENVMAHGTGGLNIDACRIAVGDREQYEANSSGDRGHADNRARDLGFKMGCGSASQVGRWPAHVVLSHADGCDGACVEGCPVAELDRQSERTSVTGKRSTASQMRDVPGTTWGNANHRSTEYPGDSGGASRFFYQAKPSRKERDAGLDDLEILTGGAATDRKEGTAGLKSPRAGAGRNGGVRNPHPTVKGITLMRYLIRLVTPAAGIVLDPFCGSGTTGCAAVLEGVRFVGLEREAEYVDLGRRRIAHWAKVAKGEPTRCPTCGDAGVVAGDGQEEPCPSCRADEPEECPICGRAPFGTVCRGCGFGEVAS